MASAPPKSAPAARKPAVPMAGKVSALLDQTKKIVENMQVAQQGRGPIPGVNFCSAFGRCYDSVSRAPRRFEGTPGHEQIYRLAKDMLQPVPPTSLDRFSRDKEKQFMGGGLCVGNLGVLTAAADVADTHDHLAKILSITPASGTQRARVIELCGLPLLRSPILPDGDVIYRILERACDFPTSVPASLTGDQQLLQSWKVAVHSLRTILMYNLVTCAPPSALYRTQLEGESVTFASGYVDDNVLNVHVNALRQAMATISAVDADAASRFVDMAAAQMGWTAALSAYVAGATGENKNWADCYECCLDDYFSRDRAFEGDLLTIDTADYRRNMFYNMSLEDMLDRLADSDYRTRSLIDPPSKILKDVLCLSRSRLAYFSIPAHFVDWGARVLTSDRMMTLTPDVLTGTPQIVFAATAGRPVVVLSPVYTRAWTVPAGAFAGQILERVPALPGPYVLAAAACFCVMMHCCIHRGPRAQRVMYHHIWPAARRNELTTLDWLVRCTGDSRLTKQTVVSEVLGEVEGNTRKLVEHLRAAFSSRPPAAADWKLLGKTPPRIDIRRWQQPLADRGGRPASRRRVAYGMSPMTYYDLDPRDSLTVPETPRHPRAAAVPPVLPPPPPFAAFRPREMLQQLPPTPLPSPLFGPVSVPSSPDLPPAAIDPRLRREGQQAGSLPTTLLPSGAVSTFPPPPPSPLALAQPIKVPAEAINEMASYADVEPEFSLELGTTPLWDADFLGETGDILDLFEPETEMQKARLIATPSPAAGVLAPIPCLAEKTVTWTALSTQDLRMRSAILCDQLIKHWNPQSQPESLWVADLIWEANIQEAIVSAASSSLQPAYRFLEVNRDAGPLHLVYSFLVKIRETDKKKVLDVLCPDTSSRDAIENTRRNKGALFRPGWEVQLHSLPEILSRDQPIDYETSNPSALVALQTAAHFLAFAIGCVTTPRTKAPLLVVPGKKLPEILAATMDMLSANLFERKNGGFYSMAGAAADYVGRTEAVLSGVEEGYYEGSWVDLLKNFPDALRLPRPATVVSSAT